MSDSKHQLKILILCTANSARSQMAEGLLRNICEDTYVIQSAGTIATKVRPEAIAVLAEIGIDISNQFSKTIDDLKENEFDFVLTVCDNAKENCPYFPAGTRLIHKSFTDPATANGSDEMILEAFRKVRDEIHRYLKDSFVALLVEHTKP